jgi:hypothetical protein
MMDLVSVGSSFNRTGSDILLPPLLPESRSLVHMRKLKSLDKVCTLYQYSPDPNPDPDPHVFGPPGSGSISQRYGSGSFFHQAIIVRKTFIPTVLWLFLDFLSLTNDVYVPSKSNKQKNLFKK